VIEKLLEIICVLRPAAAGKYLFNEMVLESDLSIYVNLLFWQLTRCAYSMILTAAL
jgi:hypothetical protein